VPSEFSEKLLLAVVAFLLGLLADVVKRLYQRERRRVEYSVHATPILAAHEPLPDAVRSKLPGLTPINVTSVTVAFENTGTLPAQNLNALIAFTSGAEVLHCDVDTVPQREVVTGAVERPNANELRLTSFSLARAQQLNANVFVSAPSDIATTVFGSSAGGDVAFVDEGATLRMGVVERAVSVIKLYVLVKVLAAVYSGIQLTVGVLFSDSRTLERFVKPSFLTSSIVMQLATMYIYLRIVLHLLAIVRTIGSIIRRRHPEWVGA